MVMPAVCVAALMRLHAGCFIERRGVSKRGPMRKGELWVGMHLHLCTAAPLIRFVYEEVIGV